MGSVIFEKCSYRYVQKYYKYKATRYAFCKDAIPGISAPTPRSNSMTTNFLCKLPMNIGKKKKHFRFWSRERQKKKNCVHEIKILVRIDGLKTYIYIFLKTLVRIDSLKTKYIYFWKALSIVFFFWVGCARELNAIFGKRKGIVFFFDFFFDEYSYRRIIFRFFFCVEYSYSAKHGKFW